VGKSRTEGFLLLPVLGFASMIVDVPNGKSAAVLGKLEGISYLSFLSSKILSEFLELPEAEVPFIWTSYFLEVLQPRRLPLPDS